MSKVKMALFSSLSLALIMLVSLQAGNFNQLRAIAMAENYFSVTLNSSPVANNAGTDYASIDAKVGDTITFSYKTESSGVVNSSWNWNFDQSVLNCAGYPDWDSADYKCTVIKTGTTTVSITIHPVMSDGTTQVHESNLITVRVGESDDCQSPYVMYGGKCTDPVPACRYGIANSTSCIDKITSGGEYIDHYSFSCLPGYEIAVNTCVKSTSVTNGDGCTAPEVMYNGSCTDPIPACRYGIANSTSCIDKITASGEYIDHYSFHCLPGYEIAVNTCVKSSSMGDHADDSTGNVPPAGYEDEVLTAFDSNPFPDTDVNDLGGKAAAELYRRAVIGGFPDGEFKGDRPVNRAEAGKFLLQTLFRSVYETANDGRFADVLNDQWYTKYVMVAAIKGIISGYPDGTFRPADPVNTAEFLKMLTLTFGLEENRGYTYLDVNGSDWFARYAGTAEKYELFPDRTNYLLPGKELTRKEVAIAIYQYLTNR